MNIAAGMRAFTVRALSALLLATLPWALIGCDLFLDQEGEAAREGEAAKEGETAEEGETLVEGEAEGEAAPPALEGEGEGAPDPIAEGETAPEGEGGAHQEGEGETPGDDEGEGESLPVEGEGEGESAPPLEGESNGAHVLSECPGNCTYTIVNTYPHDADAFTQGLVYVDGDLFESTGLYGSSSLRRVDLESGMPLQLMGLDDEYFGEGLTWFEDELYQITWRENTAFVYDSDTFETLREFNYTGEGWGITHDGERLIMSDGTPTLRFLDPQTFVELGTVTVHDGTSLVDDLNELEYVHGEVLANVWRRDEVARIDPATGSVLGWIDLSNLLSPTEARTADVLNGIAYDEEEDRLFVTGKRWPKLFEIRLVPAR